MGFKVSVDRALMTDALGTVSRATKTDSAYTILANVLLRAEDGTLTLTTFDQEIGITDAIRATVEEAGATTVHAKLLTDLLSRSAEEKVSFELSEDGKKLKVSCGGTNANLYTMPAEDYHLPPELGEGAGFTIKRSDLYDIIKRVEFCTDPTNKHPTKAFLGGAHFRGRSDGLQVEATDGYRVALADHSDADMSGDFDIIVPHRAMMEMCRILGQQAGPAIVCVTENLLQMQVDDVVFVTRLISGEFPTQIRPYLASRTESAIITVPTKKMKAIIGRVKLIAGTGADAIDFGLSAGLLTVSAKHELTGEISESVQCAVEYRDLPEGAEDIPGRVTKETDGLIWSCGSAYITDILESFDGETLALSIEAQTKPAVAFDPEDEKFRYMASPCVHKE